jgi:hypothetical protein
MILVISPKFPVLIVAHCRRADAAQADLAQTDLGQADLARTEVARRRTG